MCSKFRDLLIRYRSVVIYLVFGVLTTAVNYLIYYPLYNVANLSASVSNATSWLVAVVFAYFTNKRFVFISRSWKREVVVPEILRFVGCRAFSGAAETAILFLMVDLLSFNGNLWKIIVSVIVIILNYIFSKCIVFKNTH